MRQHKQSNVKTLWGGVIFWPLFLLAVTPLVLTTPAYAADNSIVSISVDPSVVLKLSGYLYKATTNLIVTTRNIYGFNLTMQAANSPDLTNKQDGARRIKSLPADGESTSLSSNQWGYNTYNSNMYFYGVPDGSSSAVIADVTKANMSDCTSIAKCTKSVTFAANVDPIKLAGGSYSTAVTYTVTAKAKPNPVNWSQRAAKASPSDICQAGNAGSSCLVDLDPNMIPVKYTGNAINDQWTSVANPEAADSGWYDYANKQWANAVTVKPGVAEKYYGLSRVIDPADILGFWVYIPRYRYKVLRFSGSDPAVPAQNFTIEFENKQSTKAVPTANDTWATHPAFTFGKKELNGIWFGKFETTGTTSQPTVLPGRSHISSENIGEYYKVAKFLGVYDPKNVGGGTVVTTQNSHNLVKLSSHMVNNNDWGAATYLSASKYGAGYNGVRANPDNNNTGHNYNTDYGQLTSTTNNIYGIYDMSGGGTEYIAASYTSDLGDSNVGRYFVFVAHPPYVNTYNITNLNSCTFATCGGQALYETNDGVGTDYGNHMWNGQYMDFSPTSHPWFDRGGYGNSSNSGLFHASRAYGYAEIFSAFRVALAPAPHD